MESGFILIQQDSYKEVLLLSCSVCEFSSRVSNNVIADNFIISVCWSEYTSVLGILIHTG